jgi:hypothetical protein
MNDPSMSREEVNAQTGQMAENYLNAMDEIQTAQENGEISSNTEVIDAAATENSGEGTAAVDGAGIDGEGTEDGGTEDGGIDDGGIE